MANEPPVTIVGNATGDAELRFLPSGVAVANFTVAQTPRTKNGEVWEDGETMFFRCTVWRDMAEHVAESVKRGMRLVVTGRLKIRSYDATDGSGKRTSVEVDADEVGIALRYGTGSFNKAERQQAGQPAPAADPWATPPAAQQSGWGAPPPQQQQQAPPGWAAPPQQPQQQPGPPGGWPDPPPY